MRRGLVAAAVLVGALVVLEAGAVWSGERRVSAAVCGADVELSPPVVLRVLAARTVPFEASFDERALELLVPLPDAISGVAVRDDRLHLETRSGVTVPADVQLERGTITLTPTLGLLDLHRLALRYEVVGLLPTGVEVDRLDVVGDAVVVTGRGDPREFTATGAGIRCVS